MEGAGVHLHRAFGFNDPFLADPFQFIHVGYPIHYYIGWYDCIQGCKRQQASRARKRQGW